MDNNYDYIELYKTQLSENTIILTKAIIEGIDLYLSKFSIKASLSFSAPNKEKYEEDYMNFLLSISPKISELTELNAELASLIIASDKAAKVETTILLQKRFDAFCLFEKSLYEYTTAIDTTISSNNISTSFIVSATQKFKLATQLLQQANL